jgi:hypothetical protein
MQQNGARFQHDNARPHTARIDFLNTVIGKVLISSSVYPSSSIASFQQEPQLVAEPNCSPTLLWPYSMCPNSLKSDLTVSAPPTVRTTKSDNTCSGLSYPVTSFAGQVHNSDIYCSSNSWTLPSPRFNRNRDSSLNQTVLQRCCGHTLCV